VTEQVSLAMCLSFSVDLILPVSRFPSGQTRDQAHGAQAER
jgi:hypothetical protein